MGFVEKTQDSRENPCGLLARHRHGVYISVCQQRGGGETPPSAKGFQEKVKRFLLHALRSLSVYTRREAGGRKGEGREKEHSPKRPSRLKQSYLLSQAEVCVKFR